MNPRKVRPKPSVDLYRPLRTFTDLCGPLRTFTDLCGLFGLCTTGQFTAPVAVERMVSVGGHHTRHHCSCKHAPRSPTPSRFPLHFRWYSDCPACNAFPQPCHVSCLPFTLNCCSMFAAGCCSSPGPALPPAVCLLQGPGRPCSEPCSWMAPQPSLKPGSGLPKGPSRRRHHVQWIWRYFLSYGPQHTTCRGTRPLRSASE